MYAHASEIIRYFPSWYQCLTCVEREKTTEMLFLDICSRFLVFAARSLADTTGLCKEIKHPTTLQSFHWYVSGTLNLCRGKVSTETDRGTFGRSGDWYRDPRGGVIRMEEWMFQKWDSQTYVACIDGVFCSNVEVLFLQLWFVWWKCQGLLFADICSIYIYVYIYIVYLLLFIYHI